MDRSHWRAALEAGLPAGAIRDLPEDRDFGGVEQGPQVRVHTETAEELQRVLHVARRHVLPVSVRGAGHSSGGHTSGTSGIVLEHAPADEALDIGSDDAEVPAHWTWLRLESALRRAGRDLLVATSSLDTTVAGTLSAGGFGIRSVRTGPQVDHVRAFRLIAATGETRWCSPSCNADLFHSALTGLGQVGIIDRVRLAIRDRRDHLASVAFEHATFSDLASYLLASAERQGTPALDYCAALAKQGRIESFAATCHASEHDARQHLEALPTRSAAPLSKAVISVEQFESSERTMPLERWRSCRNLWCDYCFEGPAFARFAAFIDTDLRVSLRDHLAYVMSIAPRGGAPFALDMRPPSTRQLYSIGLFYSVPRGDSAGVRHATECHARALEACLSLGGRPYLYGLWGGVHGLSPGQLSGIYGPTYTRLRQLRRELDPLGILNPRALGSDP